MRDAIRLNWFLGVLAIELWVAAWLVTFEPELRRWLRNRWIARRWRGVRRTGARMPARFGSKRDA